MVEDGADDSEAVVTTLTEEEASGGTEVVDSTWLDVEDGVEVGVGVEVGEVLGVVSAGEVLLAAGAAEVAGAVVGEGVDDAGGLAAADALGLARGWASIGRQLSSSGREQRWRRRTFAKVRREVVGNQIHGCTTRLATFQDGTGKGWVCAQAWCRVGVCTLQVLELASNLARATSLERRSVEPSPWSSLVHKCIMYEMRHVVKK